VGTATAAIKWKQQHNNNWWKWEQEGHTTDHPPSPLIVGGRWREDFDRAAETGRSASYIR